MHTTEVSSSARRAIVALWALLAAGTASAQPVYNVSPVTPVGFGVDMVELNGQLYYGGYTGDLMKSDGTTPGTTVVKSGIAPLFLTVMDVGGSPHLLFTALESATSRELWISDGTGPGTVLLKDIFPGNGPTDPSPFGLTVVNLQGLGDRLLMSADDGVNGRRLWISDGTTAGTVMVGGSSGSPQNIVGGNGFGFFCSSGLLIRTDGTAAGTVRVNGTNGEQLTGCDWLTSVPALNLVFLSTNILGGVNYELWASDGTDAGTYMVKEINPTGASTPSYLTAVGNQVLFVAKDGIHGLELWRSNGTDAGTSMVQEIVPGNNTTQLSGPSQLTNANGRLYFLVDDGVHGREPWTSDGVTASLLADIAPGPTSSMGYSLSDPVLRPGFQNLDCLTTSFEDLEHCTILTHLPGLGLDLFSADDGVNGAVLWASDGTTPGTRILDPRAFADQIRVAGQTAFMGPSCSGTSALCALSLTPALFVGAGGAPEGNAGTSPANVTAMLFPPSGSPVTVDYATADGTATTADGDYVAASATLTFAPGATTQTVPVLVNGDTAVEANETFFVNLSNGGGAPILTAQATATIANDDGPGISVSDDPNHIESGQALFFVTLSAASTDTIMVSYGTADGTATTAAPPAGDYVATGGTLTFLPGQTFKSVSVIINTDTLDEADENFFLNLSNPTFSFIADGQGVCTIIDDDPSPNLSVANVTVSEPAVTGTMSFAVSLSPASGRVVAVNYTTSDGTVNPATDGLDYLGVSGTVTIAPGAVTASIPVTTLGDNIDELNETLNMNLSNPTNVNIADGLGVGTINDNDTTNITIPNVAVAENVPGGVANFVVTFSTPFRQDITIDYATANGTATAPADYTSVSGTLTIPAGATSASIPVPIVDDNLDEPVAVETFFVNLSNNSGGTLTDPQAQGSITDNDVSSIVGANVSLPEGNSGTTPFVFDLTLSGPSVNAITLNYATVNGTATAPSDFTAASGTLTFAAGSTTTNPVTVNVNGDTTAEANETFTLNLFAIVGTTATNPTDPIGTIQNDDSPGFSINDVTVTEGNTGTLNATFTVSLLGSFTGSPSVDFATADGTAVAPADYTAASGTLTFTAGVTTRTLVVPIVGETLDEPNETFFVNLTNPTGGMTVNDPQGVGTINDNDTTSITIPNLTVAENVASGLANFVVTFSVPNSQVVTLDYATADGTALAPGDYTATSGTLTVPAGTTTMAASVPIVDDTLDEPATAETFFVNLSNSSGPAITDPQAQGSITDNDTSSLRVSDTSVTEGDTGTVDAVFDVTLDGGKTNAVTVNFATAPGTTNPATADVDYTTTTGTLSFPACTVSPCPPGSLTQTVTVPVIGDTLPEADETFVVNLSGASGAAVADAQGRGTIVDNDGLPSLSISDVTVIEPSAATTNAVFTVTLAPTSSQSVSVSYATANGTASAGSDYNTASGGLTFTPGSSTRNVTVVVRSDAAPEPTETFFVNLTNPVNADFTDDQGLGTILDPTFATVELIHGTSLQGDLAALSPTAADEDRYRIQQPARSSWEVLVDSVSGDVPPVSLDRLSSTGSVLQSALPAGESAVSLRWENASASAISAERIRVRSGAGGCGVNCDAEDVYRIQAWDTTYRVARYNNSASQVTVLVVQNPTEDTVDGTAWFWNGSSGALNGSRTFSLAPKAALSLNTSTVAGVAATSGAITITSNAPYGSLIGKAVAVESATGFTFDTSMEPRGR